MAVAAHLTALEDLVGSGTLARERVLPVIDDLADLFPGGGLRRGGSVATGGTGAMSLALASCVAASRGGAWAAFIGLDRLGWGAVAEYGIVLERCLAVSAPVARWLEAVAVAAEGVELIVTARPPRLTPGQVRRVQSRLIGRGAVLIIVDEHWQPAGAAPGGDWSPDVWLTATEERWSGIGAGHGRLLTRHITVEASGRRAGRRRRVEFLLPGPTGGLVRVPSGPAVPAGRGEHPMAPTGDHLGVVRPLRPAG